MIQVVFVVIAAVGLAAALGTILARNLVRAALYLVAFFFTVACLFVLLEAEFLAAASGADLHRCGRHHSDVRDHADAQYSGRRSVEHAFGVAAAGLGGGPGGFRGSRLRDHLSTRNWNAAGLVDHRRTTSHRQGCQLIAAVTRH